MSTEKWPEGTIAMFTRRTWLGKATIRGSIVPHPCKGVKYTTFEYFVNYGHGWEQVDQDDFTTFWVK